MLRLLIAVCFWAGVAAADERILRPPADSPEAPILAAFRAAASDDFAAYLDAVHPDHRVTENERADRQMHEWKRFREQYTWYVEETEEPSILVVSRKPDGPDVLRVFLRDRVHRERMPVPVKLKRFGDGWRIVVSSL